MVQFNNLCIGDGPQVYNVYLGDGQFNNLCLGDGLGLVEVESGRINTTHNVYQAAVQVSVQGVPLNMTIL